MSWVVEILRTGIGFDLSRRLGLPTPHTAQARFYLNGAPQEVYPRDKEVRILTEHVSTDFLRARYGHDEFDFFRGRGDFGEARDRFSSELRTLRRQDGGYEFDDVTDLIDVQALFAKYTLYILIELYSAFQDLTVKERLNPNSKWFFVTWDLQGGFAKQSSIDRFYERHPEAPR